MKVAITGATGLIGSSIAESWSKDGVEIQGITRRRHSLPSPLKTVQWDPDKQEFDPAPLEGTDAWIHLAGESIASRWSEAQKERIQSSRVEGARLLVNGLQKLSNPPSVLISSSAIGFYGSRGDEELGEDSPPGTGFLPNLCQAWEAEIARASELGIRTASLRTGLVLSTRGGALAKMLFPFKLGLGGPVGNGKQWVSWIHIDDVVGIARFLIEREEANGPYNTTAPNPVRQKDFAKALGGALARPALLPAPGFAIRALFGEMGQSLLLGGQRVLPRRLQELGYSFRYPKLRGALEDVLERRK